MRDKPIEKMEQGRRTTGHYASPRGAQHGAFSVVGPRGQVLAILSSGSDNETGWEHVSVSLQHRTPNWQEMCWVKDMFWTEDEVVIQYHPARAEYVNLHPYCLHLWRPLQGDILMPPSLLVGPKQEDEQHA